MRFVLSTEQAKRSCLKAINQLPLEPVAQVNIKPYSMTRTLEQNSFLWVLLTEIADRIPDEDGVIHSPEIWHHFFRIQFGFVENTITLNGQDTPVPKSSTKMTIKEMNDYLTQIQVWAAEEDIYLDEMRQIDGS